MSLTGKQKRFIRALASQMPAFFQVGKEGTSPTLFGTIDLALDANEIVKIHILKTSPIDAKTVGEEVAAATQSELVQVIGKTCVFYRESKNHIYQLPKGN